MHFSVTIEEIREGGLDLERELSREFLDMALADGGPGFRAVGVGRFAGHFDKLPGRVLMHGLLDTTIKAPCKRCLTEVVLPNPINVKMTWVREHLEPGVAVEADGDGSGVHQRRRRRPAEDSFDASAVVIDAARALAASDDEGDHANNGSFSDGDLEIEPFDGKTVPLDPMFREQLLLSLPMDVVCKDDCKGLCPVCGQDLNAAECGHERKTVDPRWAALKKLELSN